MSWKTNPVAVAALADTSVADSIGVSTQAQNAQLDEIAALDLSDGNFIVTNGTAFVAESGSTVRTSLGLGTIATEAAADFIKADGTTTVTADLNMNSHKIINVTTPVNDGDAATKIYVDTIATGLDFKQSSRAATASVGDLSGFTYTGGATDEWSIVTSPTFDGVTLSDSDRVLIKDASNQQGNGLWTYDSGASKFIRAEDADNSPENEVSNGMFTFVEEGTLAGTGWILTSPTGQAVLGTDNLVFTQFSSASTILAGDNLTKTGNTIDLDPVLVNFASTGIDDNAVSTTLTIDSASLATFVGNLSVTRDEAGGVVSGRVQNSSSSSNSTAEMVISTKGVATGSSDPFVRFNIDGVMNWYVGVDNSNSDTFIIDPGSIGAASPALAISTSGDVDISAGVLTVTHDTNQTLKVVQEATNMSNGAYTVDIDSTSQVSNTSAAGAFRVSTTSDTFIVDGQGRLVTSGTVSLGGLSGGEKLLLEGTATADARIILSQTTGGFTSTLQQGVASLSIMANGAGQMELGTNGTNALIIDSDRNITIDDDGYVANLRRDFGSTSGNYTLIFGSGNANSIWRITIFQKDVGANMTDAVATIDNGGTVTVTYNTQFTGAYTQTIAASGGNVVFSHDRGIATGFIVGLIRVA